MRSFLTSCSVPASLHCTSLVRLLSLLAQVLARLHFLRGKPATKCQISLTFHRSLRSLNALFGVQWLLFESGIIILALETYFSSLLVDHPLRQELDDLIVINHHPLRQFQILRGVDEDSRRSLETRVSMSSSLISASRTAAGFWELPSVFGRSDEIASGLGHRRFAQVVVKLMEDSSIGLVE